MCQATTAMWLWGNSVKNINLLQFCCY